MKNKRTKRSAIIATGLAALIAISGAFAFMSDHDNAINKFSFTSDDGAQSIDIQLLETKWDEEAGKSIQYGTPVDKNPVAKNIGEKDMYAFMTVILPAKGVMVQNALGQFVGVDGNAITGTDFTDNFDVKIVSNVTPADNEASEGNWVATATNAVDQTEILGLYKDAALTEEYAFGEELGDTVYFKLSSTSPLGTAGAGDYKVLEDTVDPDNYTSDILGHQFMLKVEPKAGVDLDVRELYTLETAAGGRIIDGAWQHYNATGTDADPYVDDEATPSDVYGRSAYNDATWVEITDEVSQNTIYVDGVGRVYSAHVFYWTAPLAPDAETDSLFDQVEFVNVSQGQIFDEDDLNIYVETYGLQTTGTDDALNGADADTVAGGAILWEVLTNSENQEGFDIFGVVKDAKDSDVASLTDARKDVENDYGRAS